MNIFQRSWQITKLSFKVIKEDKKMLVFSFLGGLFSIIFVLLTVIPWIFRPNQSQSLPMSKFSQAAISKIIFDSMITQIIFTILIYLGIFFIMTFFNVCVAYIIKKRLTGQKAGFFETLGYSFKKLGLIFAWSLLSTFVGILFTILEEIAKKTGGIGALILRVTSSLAGMVWGLVAVFVVPSMVFYDLGPINALKKSAEVLKKTWGESIIRDMGLALVLLTFLVPMIIIELIIVMASNNIMTDKLVLITAIITVLYIIAIGLIFNTANLVFNSALYVYANTGRVPFGFDAEMVQGAFTHKKNN